MIKYKTIHLIHTGCWISGLGLPRIKSSNDKSIVNCKRCLKKDKRNLYKDMIKHINNFILYRDNRKGSYADAVKIFIQINKDK